MHKIHLELLDWVNLRDSSKQEIRNALLTLELHEIAYQRAIKHIKEFEKHKKSTKQPINTHETHKSH